MDVIFLQMNCLSIQRRVIQLDLLQQKWLLGRGELAACRGGHRNVPDVCLTLFYLDFHY